ncbi:hypothetical protein Pfo_005546 [Paulownia fortunei]|nr:hypothetical protein Pfo_005546 [Paulownia fortunei]
MREIKMEPTQENGSERKKTSVIPWSSETNWVIAHGSLEASVTVESSDYPIDESDMETTARKSPLVLKPPVPDSGPCEIKICFEQKYDIGQIYVRSTARVYEVYYAHSPHSSNEYLCTVRCGVAERDEKLLQTNCIEDVAEEHGECLLGEVTEETVTDEGNIVTSEDDWVTIKVPEVGRSSVSDKINTNRMKNIQDIYEATAQISDADPCSLLTIRLLSLQDKGHAYVDEVYVFADPVESTDSGNEAMLAGSSTQGSLMAMFVPTLLQLSKSAVSQVQDKHASNELLKDDKMETGSRRIDEVDVGLEVNQVHKQYVKPKELDMDTAESAELQEHTSTKKCVEPINMNHLPPGHLERALEQLISRVSRVEDICSRFEEKMLKPIESIEARLQNVEQQLEKLAKNSNYIGLPHCTRISAPSFSCSESNSSSFCNEQSDYPPCGASELETKDFSSNNMPESSHDANFHPGLVVSAPEFSCGEGEEDNDDLKPLKGSPCIKPKKTLSVDDALAAALNGFLSTAIIHPSEQIQTTSGLPEHAESCQIKAQEFPAAENGIRESLRYAQGLTFKAPDFTAEEISNEEHLNYTQSSLDIASVIKNEEQDHGDEVIPPSIQSKSLLSSADLSDVGKNESTHDFGSASNGDFPAAFLEVSRTCLGNGHLNESSEVNMIDSHFEGDTSCNPVETSNDSAPELAKDSVETGRHQIYDETIPGKTTSFNPDDEDIASKQVLGHESESASEVLERYVAVEMCFKDDTPNISESSCASLLDFEFPILEVKFTSDVYTNTKSPLEALLDGTAESNTEAPSMHDNLLPINHLLVDVGVSVADGSSNLEGGSDNLCTPSSPEMNASLI